jgi:hypothetical protein
MSGCQWLREEEMEVIAANEFFRADENFGALDSSDVQFCEYTKNDCIFHFKRVNLCWAQKLKPVGSEDHSSRPA